jgi:hypothetical protein
MPQSSSARQGIRVPRPRCARPGGSAKATVGGESACTLSAQRASSVPPRRTASRSPWSSGISAEKLAASSAWKGVAAASATSSGTPPPPPESETCNRLPAGTVALPPAGSRKIGGAPV